MKTQKIGITFSAFDLLHAGHIKMLEEAKTVCALEYIYNKFLLIVIYYN